MKTWTPIFFTATLLLTAARPVCAEQTLPFQGKIITTVQALPTTEPWGLNLVIFGSGQVSHMGQSVVTIIEHFDNPSGTQVSSTFCEIAGSNGDKIFAHFTLSATYTAGPPGSLFAVAFGGTFYIDGGTGRFQDASGSAAFTGSAVIYPPDALHPYSWGTGEFSWKDGTLTLK